FVFKSKKEKNIKVANVNSIVRDKNSNFYNPNRQFDVFKKESRVSFRISHVCENLDTAEWLRRELIDSNDIYIYDFDNKKFTPVGIIDNEVFVNEKKLTVTFSFEYLFDINTPER